MPIFDRPFTTSAAILVLAQAAWATDEAHFEALMDQALAEPGPFLVGVRTDEQKPFGQTERDPPQLRDRFMRGLGVKT